MRRDLVGRGVLVALFVGSVAALVGIRLDAGNSTSGPSTSASSVTTATLMEPPIDDPDEPDLRTDVRFEDVTRSAGLQSVRRAGAPSSGYESMTGGSAVADVDDDGDLDLYLTGRKGSARLHLNDGSGRFTDDTSEAGLEGQVDVSGAVFGDWDGDGDQDLITANAGSGGAAVLVNDGTGSYSDETSRWGMAAPTSGQASGHMHGIAVADIDRDGWLDVLVTEWNPDRLLRVGQLAGLVDSVGSPPMDCERVAAAIDQVSASTPYDSASRSKLYRNDRGRRFVDSTAASGLRLDLTSPFTPVFGDADGDGWTDLFVTGDFCSSRLYLNRGDGTFHDATTEAGLGSDENGMGVAVEDVNGDGRLDWLISSISYPTASGVCPPGTGFGCSGNRLFLATADGRYSDATDDYGVRRSWWGWGVSIGDFANDGALEVAIANGQRLEPEESGALEPFAGRPASFFRLAEGAAGDFTDQVGLGTGSIDRSVVSFDFDRDGRVDLVFNGLDGPRLYRNVTRSDAHWVGIRLDDPTTPGNRSAIGARVVVEAGGRRTESVISGDGSYEAQKPLEVHVGLGDDCCVARVSVFWPGADRPQVTDVDVDRVTTVQRDAR